MATERPDLGEQTVKACGEDLLFPSFSKSAYGLDSVPNKAQRQHSDIIQEIYETPTIVENSRRKKGKKVTSEYLPQPEKRRNREELKRSQLVFKHRK